MNTFVHGFVAALLTVAMIVAGAGYWLGRLWRTFVSGVRK